MGRAWPHLRAALVALHVLAVCLMAVPAPEGAMNRSAWKDATVQAEFAAWTERVQGMGIDIDQEEFEDWAWSFAVSYDDVRDSVLAPFRPYARYCGTSQPWRMFVAPHRHPSKLHIDLMDAPDADWRPIYIARDPDHAWRARQLDDGRVRAALFRYGWPHFRRSWHHFARWVALQAAEDFPQAHAVRVRWFKYTTLTPAQARAGKAPEGTFTSARIEELADLRQAPGAGSEP